MKPEY
jgi:hypothetical protein